MRSAIAEIPSGSYTFSDIMDGDGINTNNIPICLTINISGDNINLDFEGTSLQVAGNINTTFNAVQASACYALIAALDADMPSNQGILDVVEINILPGTLLNSQYWCRSRSSLFHTCQRVVDVVLGALSKALPDKVIVAANGANTTAVFSGIDPRTDQPYLYLETLGQGYGG